MARSSTDTTKNSPAPNPELAAAAARFDRDAVAKSIRVYTLAKKLGASSKELVDVLAGLGHKKVAQSSLSKEVLNQLIDALVGVSTDVTEEAPAPKKRTRRASKKSEHKNDSEKLRNRVCKNVANEIHQLEDKVEAELAKEIEAASTETPLEDITPEVTPAPAEPSPEAAAYAPVFVAPGTAKRTRRRTRRSSSQPTAHKTEHEESTPHVEEPVATKGSTRLEAQRRRRVEKREEGRRKNIVSQAEFLARRESVTRTMIVRERERRDHHGMVTQVGVLEDGLLVEHFVTSETQSSMIGNIYLGRVQNVLPSMEAAFVDIGTGRNGVIYSSDIDWRQFKLGGRGRKIEQALHSGDLIVVQVAKDPIGHKGPRLTTQISLAGRYLVYVPGGRSAGISRKLPAPERKRLKEILSHVIPGKGGAIIRTAAENVSEEAIAADVRRLHTQWEEISDQADKAKESDSPQPHTLYEEPDMLVKVVRDLFNEDFSKLLVDGERAWKVVHSYVNTVAPDLVDRLEHFDRDQHDGLDAFVVHRVDEQLKKALGRKVWLPSGGYLIIDHTEAMVVIDVNTGKFTGSGGNLEETITKNNLEAAEEIVRQMRLRDLGGMIVVDFIDMVLPENQDLVLRRLKEALGRDRTRHEVSEVTSLGLVQMTRKRLGTGLLETFSTECEACGGRGLILHDDPVTEEQRSHKPDAKKHHAQNKKAPQEPHDDHDLEKMAAAVIRIDSDDDVDADVEAFEKSPRRKRHTRGNSRSDHRPQREEANVKPRVDKHKDKASTTRRGRRRAVRKTSASVTPKPQTHVDETTTVHSAPRRGRRRATRRARG